MRSRFSCRWFIIFSRFDVDVDIYSGISYFTYFDACFEVNILTQNPLTPATPVCFTHDRQPNIDVKAFGIKLKTLFGRYKTKFEKDEKGAEQLTGEETADP